MSTPTLQQARNHYAQQRRIALSVLSAIRKLFAQTPRPAIPQIAATTAGYQYASASMSSATIAGFADKESQVLARAFMGVSSHGFSLVEPIIATIDRVIPAPVEAIPSPWWTDPQEFMQELEQLIVSEVQDAGRSASQVEIVAAPDWQNYVRMLTPPSCARCTILAGRIYRDLEAFQRHPQCFPAGTIVSGPAARGAARRWYDGELIVIRTAGGKELSATANHPILTDQGWVPASLLTEGGYVVGRASGDRSRAVLVPDHNQVPARIEDLWSAEGMSPFGRVPVASEDFHGDGFGSSHVDVVLADGLLGHGEKVPFSEEIGEVLLALGAEPTFAFAGPRPSLQFGQGGFLQFPASVRGQRLLGTLFRQHFAGSEELRLAAPADYYAGFDQAASDYPAADLETQRQGVLALAGQVGGNDARRVDHKSRSTRWDAPAGEFSTENRTRYAERGADLRERLAGHVELDRIVDLRRVTFAGHVYNLTSSEGWYDANGFIVSNCDCVMVPVQDWQDAHDNGLLSSPDQAFGAGQVRGLSQADERAIRDGADISHVVNAHRGMSSETAFGRRVKATTAGTTKRSAWRKANPTRLVRLRPESIYQFAKDEEDAIRLLRLYGYLR